MAQTNKTPSELLLNTPSNICFPLVYVAPQGIISVVLPFNIVIDIAVDKTIRIVCFDKFSVRDILFLVMFYLFKNFTLFRLQVTVKVLQMQFYILMHKFITTKKKFIVIFVSIFILFCFTLLFY